MTIRVFLLDDHALVRVGLRMVLSAETDIEAVSYTHLDVYKRQI